MKNKNKKKTNVLFSLSHKRWNESGDLDIFVA